MKTLFLHIGLHKTGSTTLQAFLHQNRDILSAHGYLYPNLGIPEKHYGQHNLAWLLQGGQRANPSLGTWTELHHEIQTSKLERMIISSEDFETNNSSLIQRIYTQLDSYQVKIVVYLRRQDKRLESAYCEHIKFGSCSEDIYSFCQQQKQKYDYYQFLQPWREVFGRENIIIRPLEKEQISNICSDFLKVLNIGNLSDFTPVNNKNTRLGLKTLEVLRFLNEIMIPQNAPFSTRQTIVAKYHKKIVNMAANYWSDQRDYRLLSYGNAAKLLQEFESSNLKVAQEYLDRKDEPLFYEQLEDYENESLDIETLSNKEMLSLLLTLLQ